MGRTVPTYVQMVAEQEAKWAKFRRALRREDQLQFDRLIASVRYYSPAATFQCSDDPRESIVLSILLDLKKRQAAIEAHLTMPQANMSVPRAGDSFGEPGAPGEFGDSPETE